jgi:hypothetical protein
LTQTRTDLEQRWVVDTDQTCRRELLDRTLICDHAHLLHALREFALFYNGHRPIGPYTQQHLCVHNRNRSPMPADSTTSTSGDKTDSPASSTSTHMPLDLTYGIIGTHTHCGEGGERHGSRWRPTQDDARLRDDEERDGDRPVGPRSARERGLEQRSCQQHAHADHRVHDDGPSVQPTRSNRGDDQPNPGGREQQGDRELCRGLPP